MVINIVKDSKGVVLVLVLSIVALFTVMVLEFSSDQVTDIEMAYNFRDSLQAYYLTKAGVEAAKVLLKEDDPTYDSLDEDWANFSEYVMFASTFLDGPSFTGTLTDEYSKIDLNSLVKAGGKDNFHIAQLKRLFAILEIDIGEDELSDLTDAIVDWIDTDNEPIGFGGAEDDYYQGLEDPYECKDGPMDMPEEILLVKGMRPEYLYGIKDEYEGIRGYITVGTGGININTASEEVLMSLAEADDTDVIDESFVEKVLELRDNAPIKNPDNFLDQLGLSKEVKEEIKKYVAINSARFLVDVKGTMPSGAELNLKAVLDRKGNKVKTVYYRIY